MVAHAERTDFDLHLRAVQDCGSRTRSITYVIVVLIAIAIAAFRNLYYPAWDSKEFQSASRVYGCMSYLTSSKSHILSKDDMQYCDFELKSRFESLKFPNLEEFGKTFDNAGKAEKSVTEDRNTVDLDKILKQPDFSFILQTYSNEIKNRTDHEFVHIPILGIELHQNDAWILTGIVISTAMLLLWTSMQRELIVMSHVRKIIQNNESRFLVLSTQIFATPSGQLKNISMRWFSRRLVFCLIYCLPFAIQLAEIYLDIDDQQFLIDARLLDSYSKAGIEYFFEILTCIILLVIAIACCRVHLKIDHQIENISKTNYDKKVLLIAISK